jgi:hypothetical protein
MGGVDVQLKTDPEGAPIRIAADDFVDLASSGALAWPTISGSDIDDRSKADWVFKSLAVIQIVWFIAQLIGRAAGALPVTTLELFTLGTVVCAAVTYAAWWEKPFDIRTPLTIDAELVLPDTIHGIPRLPLFSRADHRRRPSPLKLHGRYIVMMSVLLVFGGMHLLGWHFHFSTTVEQWLWRGGSLESLILPVAMACFSRIAWWLDPSDRHKRVQITWAGYIFGVPYMLCRGVMFVEMFVGLRAAQFQSFDIMYATKHQPGYLQSIHTPNALHRYTITAPEH